MTLKGNIITGFIFPLSFTWGKLQIIFKGGTWHFHRWALPSTNVNCRANNFCCFHGKWSPQLYKAYCKRIGTMKNTLHAYSWSEYSYVEDSVLPMSVFSLFLIPPPNYFGIRFQTWINFCPVWTEMCNCMCKCILHHIF